VRRGDPHPLGVRRPGVVEDRPLDPPAAAVDHQGHRHADIVHTRPPTARLRTADGRPRAHGTPWAFEPRAGGHTRRWLTVVLSASHRVPMALARSRTSYARSLRAAAIAAVLALGVVACSGSSGPGGLVPPGSRSPSAGPRPPAIAV